MADWFADPVNGSNANDGSTLALAKKTLDSGTTGAFAIAFTAGDVLKLINSGTHVWPTTESTLSSVSGTDFRTDPGLVIRGEDINGVPAMVTVAPLDADGDVARFGISLAATAKYILWQNVIFDATGRPTDTSRYVVCRMRVSNSAGPMKFQYGGIKGTNTGVAAVGERNLVNMNSTSPNDAIRVDNFYFQNAKEPMGVSGWGGATTKAEIQNCVAIYDNDDRSAPLFNPGLIGAAGDDNKFIKNTFYESIGTSSNVPIANVAPNADVDVGTVDFYSNLIFIETTGTVESFMSGDTTTVTKAGTINSNVILGGPSVTAGDLTAEEWYETPWDANEDDLTAPDEQTLDTVAYAQVEADVFNAPTTTYSWELPNGLSITILKDLRPKQYKNGGLWGAVPGALPAAPVGAGDEDTDAGGGDPDDPASTPYLDVIPFYAPVLELDLNLRMSTERNRKQQYYVRSDVEDAGFREYASRRISVAASTTDEIISGVETAEYIFMEADEAVQLNAGKVADVFLPAAKVVVMKGGEYQVIKVKNGSATTAANTIITEVD